MWRLSWPKRSSVSVQRDIHGHKLLGLFVAALMYVVCVSGTLSVFAPEWRQIELFGRPTVTKVSETALKAAIVNARARTFGDFSLTLPAKGQPHWLLRAGERTYALNAAGQISGLGETPLTKALIKFHMDLFLPAGIGLVVVGLMGVALLALSLGGLLAHPRIFKDAFLWRWSSGPRLQIMDLHNRLSVWLLPFHLVIAFSGAIFGLFSLLTAVLGLAVFNGDTARAMAPMVPAPLAAASVKPFEAGAVLTALQDTQRRLPLGAPSFISVSQHEGLVTSVMVTASLDHRLAFGEMLEFTADGRFARSRHFADGTVGQQVFSSLYKLHFGSFGGLMVRLLYGLFGVALCVICWTGLEIWFLKSAQKGKPRPRLTALWRSFCVSMPIALILAVISVQWGASLPWVFCSLLMFFSALGYGVSLNRQR